MKLLPEKVSKYFHQRKVSGMKRKIHDLNQLVEDLYKEAVCDPDRTDEYHDSIECVQDKVGIITEQLRILDAGVPSKV